MPSSLCYCRKVVRSAAALVVAMANLCWLDQVHSSEPWIIDHTVTVTTPMDVGDVIVVSGGSLIVSGVPEPGFRVSENLIAGGNGQVHPRGVRAFDEDGAR